MIGKINFLLPVKELANCKQRLKDVLTDGQRRQIVLSLLEKNLSILKSEFSDHHVLVVTPDPQVAEIARHYGAEILQEKCSRGLNAAVKAGTERSLAQGFQTQVVLAPDISHLQKGELMQLLRDTGSPKTVRIGAAWNQGTNALLTRPPDAISFHYGEQSAKWMALAAKRRKVPCRVLFLKHLSRDVDTPEDLAFISDLIMPISRLVKETKVSD